MESYRVVESYRPGSELKPKQMTLKSFGYLEDQADTELFMREVETFDADQNNREQCASLKMYSGQNRKLNYGYKCMIQAAKRKARGYHIIEGFSCMIYLIAAKLQLACRYDNWSKTIKSLFLTG